MFCLKEHYLLSGNFRTHLWKSHQAVKFLCTQRPIDRHGETPLCVIIWIAISLVMHELKSELCYSDPDCRSELFCGLEMN